ncbi:MAG TPA: tRNA isopentenyl-2-thiomethyl-A-37 hydroxylase MiaE [Byssovorax sp.]
MLCLAFDTDAAWAEAAAEELPAVLVDHAHCEMKAASNAMSLATRWPAVAPEVGALPVARALVAIAEEELAHFRAVLVELERRELPLGKPAVDVYAAGLRAIVERDVARAARAKVVDRLLVGALIEARSCERFRRLADVLDRRGEPLARFYDELFTAEARHYTTLVDLAIEASDAPDGVRARLAELAIAEGRLVERITRDAAPGARASIHG